MTQFRSDLSEYDTTLRLCLENIEDAKAIILSAKNMVNAFAEGYLDVSDEVFIRRANVSHNAFINAANQTIDSICDSANLLSIASALVRGAAISKTQEIVPVEIKEEG